MIKIDKNILSDDLSPYLNQHKDNPVNWQTWSIETLNFAKKNKRPILLSIGYASFTGVTLWLMKVLKILKLQNL